jgi:hypothetical protein
MSALRPRFTINNAITAGLTTIERARGFLHEAGIEEFEALVPSVNRRTLQRDLRDLIQRGVTKFGAGSAVRYQLRIRSL